MYCITLKGSRRTADVRKELARVGLDEVKVLEFERDYENGMRGCFQSHQAALRRGIESGCKSIVVFEDDVVFREPNDPALAMSTIVQRARSLVEIDPCLIVGLGGLIIGPVHPEPLFWNFFHAKFACAQAYVISFERAVEVCNIEFHYVHYDKMLFRLFGDNMAVTIPTVAFQSPYYSEMTTTESTLYYYGLTLGRNVLHPVVVQRIFELFWVCVGVLKALLRKTLAKVTKARNGAKVA